MKKVLCLIIIAVFLCSCTVLEQNNDILQNDKSGVWLSYYELNSMLRSEKGFKEEFNEVVENCSKMKIQNLYIHVRAFCDSLYKSDYFPQMENSKTYDYDVFEYIISECKRANLKVHAWINPYRVSTSARNIDDIDTNSPAYKWLKDDNTKNDSNVGFSNGIYLNPASSEARGLVLDGIREIIAKYEVYGIHFDDYFYPTQSADFDAVSYAEYKENTQNPLELSDWRRMNVNALIASCYTAIKYANKDIVFSISPAASLEHNFENLYADVEEWIENGYVDEIIPQLYFGFEYPDKSFCFDILLEKWKEIASLNKNVQLKIGLANYKAIPELKADKEEWEKNSDIIARQVEICEKDSEVSGYVYYSYSSLFSQKEPYKKQRERLEEYLGERNG